MLVYRVNFILWRVRTVLQFLMVYFVWWTVFQSQTQIFGYTEQAMLTYIVVSALVRAIILSSRVMDVGGQINEGNVVNFLIKPLDFIWFYFIRDLSDKALNISFVIFEIAAIIFLLQPNIMFQTDLLTLSLFVLAVLLGIILYFALSFTFGLLAFWLENIWGIYFLFFMLIEALGGALFPIDILPKTVANIVLLTPFPYLLYFPAKIYLGQLNYTQLISGFAILIFWVLIFWVLMKTTLKAGLKTYTAVGH